MLTVQPCTTFVLKTKNGVYFGRNLDWVSDIGLLMVNKRNMLKESLVFAPEKSIQWTSKYGSISFNQFGKEFPFGGINEKGLVIEIMISEAIYPEPDERPMVNELQWIQYQLDNSASVEEVIATDKILRIGQTHELLHFLICDKEGNAAVIEFIDRKMVVYKGEDLPVSVLENEPYASSLEGYNTHKTCRFSSAANLIKEYKSGAGKDAIKYSFNILEAVALSAEWSVVYDITNQQIHFKTNTNQDIRIVDMANFDFTCSSNVLGYDLSGGHSGDIDKKFTKFNAGTNADIVKKALELNAIYLDQAQSNLLVDYFKQAKCETEQ